MIDLTHFQGKNIAVLGLGKSGFATAKALELSRVDYVAWDDNSNTRAKATAYGLTLEDLTNYDFKGTDYLVLSPGISHTLPTPHPIVVRAKQAGLEIINDVFLFKEAMKGKDIIAITGTNGKSTTTALIYHVLQARLTCQMGGNIGTALMELNSECDVTVAELSSYQTEITPNLNATGVVWLNITPDHIDRHGDIDGYIAAKARIFETELSAGIAVICIDDAHSQKIYEAVKNMGKWTVIPVSTKQILEDGVCIVDGDIFDKGVNVGTMHEAQRLKGTHNHQNAACAYAIARYIYSIQPQNILSQFQRFDGLAHRQFHVARIGNVDYINDSKATNAEATEKALQSYENIYWLAGGVAKDGGLLPLKPYLSTVQKVYLYGECALDFKMFLDGQSVTCEIFLNLEDAFQKAHTDAQESNINATVLLSPAAASFDQYPNFEKRGEHFEERIKKTDV